VSRTAAIAGVLSIVALALPMGPAVGTPGSEPLTDLTPIATSLKPELHHKQPVFEVSFTAGPQKERRFVTSLLLIEEASNRLFLGQTIQCTAPSGKTVTGMETGRNFWPQGDGGTVASFVLNVNEPGTWKCSSVANVCEPGVCEGSSNAGSGNLVLATGSLVGPDASHMLVTAPLGQLQLTGARVPKKDVPVTPSRTMKVSKTFKIDPSESLGIAAEFSLTNCIERDYPRACRKQPSVAINGSSTISSALTIRQVPVTPGATCPVQRATQQQGAGRATVSAQQHHATWTYAVLDFPLSTDPSCSRTLTVEASFTAERGNGFVIESGNARKPESIVIIGQVPSSYQPVATS
jgi:hypothetical protein